LSKSTVRIILETVSQPMYKLYSTTNSGWSYKGLDITVLPEVFHPNWFVTSRMLLDYLELLDLRDKEFLELGCGSGTQACRAVQKGAIGYASDITSSSCKNAKLNADQNSLNLEVFQSDIFEQIPPEHNFDIIFVNPPFIEKYPEREKDFAFCCGEQYEYFDCLFRDLSKRLKPDGKLVMALAKSCNCEKIEATAKDWGFSFKRIEQKKKFAETNYLIQVSKIN